MEGWLHDMTMTGQQRLTINLLEMRTGASRTCDPANLARSGAVAGETRDLPTQAVAYDVEILQLGARLCHEELH
jgi:hypothetical protein